LLRLGVAGPEEPDRDDGRMPRLHRLTPPPRRTCRRSDSDTASMLSFHIQPQGPQHAPEIDPLLDRTFGTDRMQRTVYRLREGIAPLADLAFVAVDDAGRLLASLRFWPIRIEDTPAILLGPLAVEPKMQGQGVGRALVRHGLNAARLEGHRLCVVVGEPEYYAPYGFVPATPAGLVLPGPVQPERFQALELTAGALEGVRGLIQRDARYAVAGEGVRPGAALRA